MQDPFCVTLSGETKQQTIGTLVIGLLSSSDHSFWRRHRLWRQCACLLSVLYQEIDARVGEEVRSQQIDVGKTVVRQADIHYLAMNLQKCTTRGGASRKNRAEPACVGGQRASRLWMMAS